MMAFDYKIILELSIELSLIYSLPWSVKLDFMNGLSGGLV